MATITNNYAEGACVFMAGSTQNGDVYITDSAISQYGKSLNKSEEADSSGMAVLEGYEAELRPYIEKGLLNEDLQPVGLSRAERAVLAHDIADRFEIKNVWKVFESAWGMKAMRSDYDKAMKQKKIGAFLSALNDI